MSLDHQRYAPILKIMNVRLTVASERELEEYRKKVIPLQNEIFRALAPLEDSIYLTGGTALSRFYYEHRISEDLDFFTTHATLKEVFPSVVSLLEKEGFEIEIAHQSPSFARLFVNGYKLELVVEFNHYGELTKTEYGIYVNNLEDIGANKITAWEDRAELKDLIDLFYLCKDVPVEKLFKIADLKRVVVPYEKFLAINTQGISGEALLTKRIDEEELEDFLNRLSLFIRSEIKKKEEETLRDIDKHLNRLLWDFPKERRKITPQSVPVLKRRLKREPIYVRNAFALLGREFR